MKIKSKGIRIDSEGKLQLDKRCKENYWINQPERSKREDNEEDPVMKYIAPLCDTIINLR